MMMWEEAESTAMWNGWAIWVLFIIFLILLLQSEYSLTFLCANLYLSRFDASILLWDQISDDQTFKNYVSSKYKGFQ